MNWSSMQTTSKHDKNYLAMNKTAIIQLLGLTQRAGQLVTGENLVLKAIRNQSAQFVFIANDASQPTIKKFTDKCKFYQVDNSIVLSRQEISNAIGQSRSVVAIIQSGFAKKFKALTEKIN